MLWTARPDGRIEDFAERWLAWTGLSREQALGDGWMQVPHPDELPRMAAAWRRAVATGEPYDVEHRIRMADGSFRWMRSRAVPRRDPASGAILRWYGTTEDVHDRHLAEEALRESEARYRALFTSIDQGYCLCEMILDAEGRPADYRFLEVNPRFEAMTGLQGAVGRTALELVPNLEPRWVETYARVALGGEALRFEQGSDAMGRWFDVFAAPVEPRGRFAIVFNDVTAAKAAAADLRAAEARFRALFEASPVPAYVTDPADLAILDCNEAAAAMLGYGREELRSRRLTDIDAGQRGDEIRARATAVAAGEVHRFETRHRTRAGELRDVLVSAVPVELDGRPLFYSVVVDITERRRAEAALRELTATLERRVEERTLALADTVAQLDAFAYTISHDLRAPLRAMEGFAKILLEEHADALGERGRRYARRIVDAAARMDALIQDLLAYSRLSRADIELGRVDLERAVDAAVADLLAEAGPAPPVVAVERPLPPVRGNRAVLGQIVANLLGNAAKFVAAGERPWVRVRAELLPDGDARKVRLWVEDAGLGIAPEHQARVFDVFERLHGQESYPGTGIGLAIVRKGAERMGGKAGVESEGEGRGSRFWVELPAADELAAEREGAP